MSLVIKSFQIEKVVFTEQTQIVKEKLFIRKKSEEDALKGFEQFLKKVELFIIEPDKKNIFVNSIMDFLPIATKVVGKLGEGITHTLTGVYVMLAGVDENGVQAGEFGSSEGILAEQVVFNRAGTPADNDIILQVNIIFRKDMTKERTAIIAAHRACDFIVQEIREKLKKLNGSWCTEKIEFADQIRDGNKKVIIIKQVTGQGAMSDTWLLADEPTGVQGGGSIIDFGNLPIILTSNEYRDGALRAMN